MEFLWFICMAVAIWGWISQNKEKKDAQLLKENPEAWKVKKQAEDDAKNRQFATGVHIGSKIAERFFMK